MLRNHIRQARIALWALLLGGAVVTATGCSTQRKRGCDCPNKDWTSLLAAASR